MTGSPAAGIAPDRILRECHCPPWVVRCAHVDDVSLALVDNSVTIPGCSCEMGAEVSDFGVIKTLGRPVPCPLVKGCTAYGFLEPNVISDDVYPSHDEALAAFYAAEEALLRGDA